jgi:uncharacterized membrane protein YhaH (DUF805 family)
MPQNPTVPAIPGEAIAQSNPDKAIDLIQAQIAGVKKEIADLTSQLTPGASSTMEEVIQVQISSANDRLGSLQEQLDRVVSGENTTTTVAFSDPNDIPHGVRQMVETIVVAIAFVAVVVPIIRMIGRRFEARSQSMGDAGPRLQRLEQAVDAVAIEVERVSEGQRYTNKLLGELRALPAPNPMEQWPQPARVAERVERAP